MSIGTIPGEWLRLPLLEKSGSAELPQTTSNHPKPPQTTPNYRKLPQTTANDILYIYKDGLGWGGGGEGVW